MNDIVMEFGKRVRHYRTSRKISQEKLAELCGLHPTYIGQIERGEKNCTLETADKISKGLNVPLDELICKINTVNDENKTVDDIYRLVHSLDNENQRRLYRMLKILKEML